MTFGVYLGCALVLIAGLAFIAYQTVRLSTTQDLTDRVDVYALTFGVVVWPAILMFTFRGRR